MKPPNTLIPKAFDFDSFQKVAAASSCSFVLGNLKGSFDASIGSYFSKNTADSVKYLIDLTLFLINLPSIVLFILALFAAPARSIICLICAAFTGFVVYEIGYYFMTNVIKKVSS